MFENTLRLVEEADLTFLHVFPYSERDGTPAAKMPSVPVPGQRRNALHACAPLATKALARFLGREVGRSATLLVEQSQGGHTETFAPFRFGDPANAPSPGSLAPVLPERVEDGMLIGRLAA